jgi:creatinine amidohydrolase/Fe(II)-dependent formamide hydrolase-like protein
VHLERLTGRDAPVTPSRELTTVNTFPQKYPDGIMGIDPRNATREAGQAILAKSVEICARELNEWK